jgi:hypothetical protein
MLLEKQWNWDGTLVFNSMDFIKTLSTRACASRHHTLDGDKNKSNLRGFARPSGPLQSMLERTYLKPNRTQTEPRRVWHKSPSAKIGY